MSMQRVIFVFVLSSCVSAIAADATCSSTANPGEVGSEDLGLHLLQKSSVSKRSAPALIFPGDEALVPKLPEILTLENYETYLREVTQSLVAPALEYQYRDVESASYEMKGLAMSAHWFPGLRKQVEDIVNNGLTGDIYETGTWRGGSSIFMLSVLRAYEKLRGREQPRRQYFGFDSFEGFEKQGENEALDEYLAKAVYKAPLEKVRASFDKFGVLDDRDHFVKGYFEDTIPQFTCPNPIAILRLDGDLYSSTKVVLDHLYPCVETGGWVIIDDYVWKPPEASNDKICQDAVNEYRTEHQITSPLIHDFKDSPGAVSWKKGL